LQAAKLKPPAPQSVEDWYYQSLVLPPQPAQPAPLLDLPSPQAPPGFDIRQLQAQRGQRSLRALERQAQSRRPSPEQIRQWEAADAMQDPTGGLETYLFKDKFDTLQGPRASFLAKAMALYELFSPPGWKTLLKQTVVEQVLRNIPPPKVDELPGFPGSRFLKKFFGRETWIWGNYELRYDRQHGRVEKHRRSNGEHMGEFEWQIGKQTKPPNPKYNGKQR
jgi:hypothetical protein